MPWKNGNPPLYHVWRSMLGRCYYTKNKQYKDYGGRGIKVCPQWKDDFKQFYSDMSSTYSPDLSLDRIDNNQDYTPDNCRWATRRQQQRNQRVTRRVKIEGIEYIAADLAEVSGLKTDTIVERAQLGLTYLEVVSPERRTFTEGLALGAAASVAVRKASIYCRNGHRYTPRNTKITKEGWRQCLTCLELKIARRSSE